jgi:tRNA(His) 5'-end guanylyltransferase
MCSIASSMATMAFNYFFEKRVAETYNCNDWDRTPYWGKALDGDEFGYFKTAMFDDRCFNIPKEEVANLIYWRQLDATRNSIQMVGQANFSQKELHGKSCNKIQDMLMLEKGINWNDFPVYQKRGSCAIKQIKDISNGEGDYRTEWIIDKDIPIFKGEDRDYIERFIYVGE